MQYPADFRVARVITVGRDYVVCHLEFLPLAIHVRMALAPFSVQADCGSGQVFRVKLAREEKHVIAAQIRTVIGRSSYSKALLNRVADATGPIPVLVRIENAAPVCRRRVSELSAEIKTTEGHVCLHSRQTQVRYAAIVITVRHRHVDERIYSIVVPQKKRAKGRGEYSGPDHHRAFFPESRIVDVALECVRLYASPLIFCELFEEVGLRMNLHCSFDAPMRTPLPNRIEHRTKAARYRTVLAVFRRELMGVKCRSTDRRPNLKSGGGFLRTRRNYHDNCKQQVRAHETSFASRFSGLTPSPTASARRAKESAGLRTAANSRSSWPRVRNTFTSPGSICVPENLAITAS